MKSVADLVADLKAGDRVLVQARVCKDELKDPARRSLRLRLRRSSAIRRRRNDTKKKENDEEKTTTRFSLGGNRSSV